MSVIFKSQCASFIDHRDYVQCLYKNVSLPTSKTKCFSLSSKLFSIKIEDKKENRKRKPNYEELLDEVSAVKQMYETFVKQIPGETRSAIYNNYNSLGTAEVRDLSKKLFESTVFDYSGNVGGNNSFKSLVCTVKNEDFLIPPQCRFFCGCIKEQCEKIKAIDNKFNILVADPPWWNKFIRRLKNANEKLSYKMMYNEEIASLPIKDLLSNNSLVAVWCTNSPSNISAVKDLIFPTWGVTYVTTWFWMKVSIELQPICSFGTGHQKQPFERLMIGKVGEFKKYPETHLFMSIPSALHSHKPPLLDLLSSYIADEKPQVLELFARYLLPNTTSVGFEPLKWQHMSLYETLS